jgi:hypothetical protein
VHIRSVTPLAAGESFTLIYNVTDWYCKNEGTWGSGRDPSAYKTYYSCGTAGIWEYLVSVDDLYVSTAACR